MTLEYKFSQEDAVIALGATTSDVIRIYGKTIVGILTPVAMTGTGFSFMVSIDGTTYVPFYNPYGVAIETVHVVDAARHIGVEFEDFMGVNYVKLVSNDTEAAERTITLSLRTL